MTVLHDSELSSGEWWACSQPERPADFEIVYDERCRACCIQAQVDLMLNGDAMTVSVSDQPPDATVRHGGGDPRGGHMTLFPTRDPDTDRPGLVRHDASTPSREAAVAVWPTTGTKRAAVLAAIAESPDGLTDEEVVQVTGIRADTARARRVELVRDGWVGDSGTTRPTETGCEATVWVISGAGRMELARQTGERA